MNGELWLAVGTIVAAILTLAGVIFKVKSTGGTETIKTLSKAMQAMGEENTRLAARVTELEREVHVLQEKLEENQKELERVYGELGRHRAMGK